MNVLEYAKEEFRNVSNVEWVEELGEYNGRKDYVIHSGEMEVNVIPRIALDIMGHFREEN